MKLTTKLLYVFLIAVLSTPASAKKWRVNNALSVPGQVDFLELKDAVDSPDVLSGDTVYVEGSAQEYEGGIEIHKQLTIVGPGFFMDQGNVQPSSCNQLPAVIGASGILIGFGSDGTYITGMTIYLNVNSTSVKLEKTSNVTLTRNHIGGGILFNQGSSSVDINVCENITITRNLICADVFFSGNSVTNTIWISNNLIRGGISINVNATISDVSNGTVINNTLSNSSTIAITGSEIAFNYAGTIRAYTDNISIHDNILDDNSSNNQTIVASNASNVIDPYDDDSFSCNNDNWTLPASDQTATHGAYNGGDPYYPDNPISPANLPAWPVIYECTVNPCGDTNLQVNFKVRTNN